MSEEVSARILQSLSQKSIFNANNHSNNNMNNSVNNSNVISHRNIQTVSSHRLSQQPTSNV